MNRIRTLSMMLCALLSGCNGPTERPADAPPASVKAAPDALALVTTTPAGRPDTWWKDRHEAIVASVRAGGHRVVFLGDSITQGWEGPGKDIWTERLAPLHAVNAGISADRTQHVLYRLDNGLLAALRSPANDIRCVVLLIGTNNTSPPPDSPGDIATGVEAVVSRLRTGLPAARIVLVDILPRGRFHNVRREVIDDVNARLARQTSTEPGRISRLDLRGDFVDPQGEIPESLMPDALHLSDMGYRVWADRAVPLIENALR